MKEKNIGMLIKTWLKKLFEPKETTNSNGSIRKKTRIQNWLETIIWAIILALFIRAIFIQAFKIPTGSMQPTLLGAHDYKIGDHLLVNKFIYGSTLFGKIRLPIIRKPKRGDVIVFKYPNNPKVYFVKRCIGLPGETLEIKNKRVYINGKLLDEPWLRRFPIEEYFKDKDTIYPKELSPRDNFGPITIPDNAYFAMGDNRDNSEDSRFWGVLDYKYLRGEAIVVYWPPKRIQIIH